MKNNSNNKSAYVKLTPQEWAKRKQNRIQNKINNRELAETLAFQVAIKDFKGEWKPMDENPGYIILDDSRIWSIKRKIFRKVINQNIGYTFSGSFIYDGKKQLCLTHRLCAKNFIPNPQGKPEVQHISGVKTENHKDSLIWVTHAENMLMAKNDSLMPKGETSGVAKLTEDMVREIRNSTETSRALAKRFSVSDNCVANVRHGKTWQHLVN